jgi:hypothetical protein
MALKTTLTLDDDVARKLADESRRSGRPLRVVINEALRRGLVPAKSEVNKPFRVKAKALGLREGLSLECAAQLLDQVEGPNRK